MSTESKDEAQRSILWKGLESNLENNVEISLKTVLPSILEAITSYKSDRKSVSLAGKFLRRYLVANANVPGLIEGTLHAIFKGTLSISSNSASCVNFIDIMISFTNGKILPHLSDDSVVKLLNSLAFAMYNAAKDHTNLNNTANRAKTALSSQRTQSIIHRILCSCHLPIPPSQFLLVISLDPSLPSNHSIFRRFILSCFSKAVPLNGIAFDLVATFCTFYTESIDNFIDYYYVLHRPTSKISLASFAEFTACLLLKSPKSVLNNTTKYTLIYLFMEAIQRNEFSKNVDKALDIVVSDPVSSVAYLELCSVCFNIKLNLTSMNSMVQYSFPPLSASPDRFSSISKRFSKASVNEHTKPLLYNLVDKLMELLPAETIVDEVEFFDNVMSILVSLKLDYNSGKYHILNRFSDILASTPENPTKEQARRSALASIILSKLAEISPKLVSSHLAMLINTIFIKGVGVKMLPMLERLSKKSTVFDQVIQQRILDHIAYILAGVQLEYVHRDSANSHTPWNMNSIMSDLVSIEIEEMAKMTNTENWEMLMEPFNPSPFDFGVKQSDLIYISLTLLSSYTFKSHDLTDFVHDVVVTYLDHDDYKIRLKAVEAAVKLLLPHNHSSARSHVATMAGAVLTRLLLLAISDPSIEIRKFTIRSLNNDRFKFILAQPDIIKPLFIVLNDSDIDIREAAVRLVGSLTSGKHSYTTPVLKRLLLQLLTELEFTPDVKARDQAARLLTVLVDSSPSLVKPFCAPVIKTLTNKLSLDNVSVEIIQATGRLMMIGLDSCRDLIPDTESSLVAIISSDVLANPLCRNAAIEALCTIVRHTGLSHHPYLHHKNLLTTLFALLNRPSTSTEKHQILVLIGLLGAPDLDKLSVDNLSQSDSQNESPTVELHRTVVQLLMKPLRDRTLSPIHFYCINAISVLMSLYNSKDRDPYLNLIIPPLIEKIKVSSGPIHDHFLLHLVYLTNLLGHSASDILKIYRDLILEKWDSHYIFICPLVEELSSARIDTFRNLLPRFVAEIVTILKSNNDILKITRMLQTVRVLCNYLGDYLHLIIPALTSIFSDPSAPIEIRKLCLQTIGKYLTPALRVEEYSSRILHPVLELIAIKSTPEPIRQSCIEVLISVLEKLDSESAIFIPVVLRSFKSANIMVPPTITSLISSALNGKFITPHQNSHLHRLSSLDYGITHLLSSVYGIERAYLGKLLAVGLDQNFIIANDIKEIENVTPFFGDPMSLFKVQEAELRSNWYVPVGADWQKWYENTTISFLQYSPHFELRLCRPIIKTLQQHSKDLLPSAFASIHNSSSPAFQAELVSNFVDAMKSSSIPPDVLQNLLNLAEFMEHLAKKRSLNAKNIFDANVLAPLARRCSAYAKALHYLEPPCPLTREEHSMISPSDITALIDVNNLLGLSETAIGVLRYSHKHNILGSISEAPLLESLHRYEEALSHYLATGLETKKDITGTIRCFSALGRHVKVLEYCDKYQSKLDRAHMAEISSLVCFSALAQNELDRLPNYIEFMSSKSPELAFYKTLIDFSNHNFAVAQKRIKECRRIHLSTLQALVGESYNRAYKTIVTLTQLAELDEILSYQQSHSAKELETIKNLWSVRASMCRRDVSVLESLLVIRKLLIKPSNDVRHWLDFAHLCKEQGRVIQSCSILVSLLEEDPYNLIEATREKVTHIEHQEVSKVLFSPKNNILEQRRNINNIEKSTQEEIFSFIKCTAVVPKLPNCAYAHPEIFSHYLYQMWIIDQREEAFRHLHTLASVEEADERVKTHCLLTLVQWLKELRGPAFNAFDTDLTEKWLSKATSYSSKNPKVWHQYALILTRKLNRKNELEDELKACDDAHCNSHLSMPSDIAIRTINACIQAIRFSDQIIIDDVLNLLQVWFHEGEHPDVQAAVARSFEAIPLEAWLMVIPQIIARIHTTSLAISRLVHNLLCKVAVKHPQAFVYPITVASKSNTSNRKADAISVIEHMSIDHSILIAQAKLVSSELVRVSILWHEQWYRAITDASLAFFADKDVQGFFELLFPLHDSFNKGPSTRFEKMFYNDMKNEINRAYDLLQKYARTQTLDYIPDAWIHYLKVFNHCEATVSQLSILDLKYVSPKLAECKDLVLVAPDFYVIGKQPVRISCFRPQIEIKESKQKPRTVTIVSSTGKDLSYLLKGNEDLRQDERVMQIIGHVNQLLNQDQDLQISRYAVTPLAPNSGLISYLLNCDTLHEVLTDFRDSRNALKDLETRIIAEAYPYFDRDPVIMRIRAFEHVYSKCKGDDIAQLLYIKSRSSETWLTKRVTFSRSMAVMSMIGHILGLGDRHPSNIMVHRTSAKINHIDFGDCFEAAINRVRYPERVPFRLTRIMRRGMGLGGEEGLFTASCETTLNTIRENKDSILALMEANLYDPLITWKGTNTKSMKTVIFIDSDIKNSEIRDLAKKAQKNLEENYIENMDPVSIMNRVVDKINGREFDDVLESSLTVQRQVQRLIRQATCIENLAAAYIGWHAYL